MSSKEELYKRLVDNAPYGTLFFAYGVCIDANPRSLDILDCEKNHLVGASLDEISGEESTALVDLKLQLKKATRDSIDSLVWDRPNKSGAEPVDLNLLYAEEGNNELIVTLQPRQSKDVVQPAPEAEETTDHLAQSPQQVSSAIHSPVSTELELAAFQPCSCHSGLENDELDPPILTEPVTARALGGDLWVQQPNSHEYYFDSLTSLPSRHKLLLHIREFLNARRDGNLCGALLMIDLDHFKDINDSWGHGVGDEVIKKVGRAIAGLVSGDNILARLNGDEFLMFIPDISGSIAQAAWDAQSLAERIREVVAAPIFLDGHDVILTASIGIALLTDANLTAERALQYADTAMHEAKRKGRNSIAFFDPCITEKAQRQIGLNARLRKALDNQEFALYVQPQICVHTGRVQGGEALLRWINADRVTNMPGEFIPVLESSGLIVDVGHWVIRTACEYIRNLIDAGLWKDYMRLGINISPRQFRDPQLVEVVQHSVTSYGIDPRLLDFEITESIVVDDVDETIRKMHDIKRLGASFSIDDFGIGYSSMIYLKRLPFDHLKIDREFVRNISRDADSRGVVEAIMAVSKQYGLDVMAEGVENQDSLEVLRKVGCNSYQGAHYSMPVPFDRFRRMLAA